MIFELLDAEGNVIVDDITSTLSISARDGEAYKATGTTRTRVQNGTASFRDIVLIGSPGSEGDFFDVSCPSIRNPVTDANGVLLPGEISTTPSSPLTVSFRFCGPGEIE